MSCDTCDDNGTTLVARLHGDGTVGELQEDYCPECNPLGLGTKVAELMLENQALRHALNECVKRLPPGVPS